MKTEEEIMEHREFLVLTGVAETEVGVFVLALIDWVLE